MAKRAPRKNEGRPSIFTKDLADKICEKLALGESMRTVCKDEEIPSMQTIFRWLREKPEFREQYEVAKQESTDAMSEDILDIADDGTNDWMEREAENGSYTVLNTEAISRSRLRVDTRKWLMAKMKPKKYGEKMDVTSDGKAIKGNSIIVADFSNEADSE